MTACTMTRTNPTGLCLLLMMAAAAVLTMVAVQSTVTAASHAAAKHGQSLATHARQCSDDNQVFQIWASTRRGTLAEICELNGIDLTDGDKTWTIRILDKVTGEEITVFQHTGDIWSLEEYLCRQLYTLI